MTQDKIKELLAVPDLPEEEQVKWLGDLYFKNAKKEFDYLIDFALDVESLADLAFRLRDEISFVDWSQGLILVYKAERLRDIEKYEEGCPFDYGTWSYQFARPIHWIIAALIAKELAKESK